LARDVAPSEKSFIPLHALDAFHGETPNPSQIELEVYEDP
jgi:hypothetical protein